MTFVLRHRPQWVISLRYTETATPAPWHDSGPTDSLYKYTSFCMTCQFLRQGKVPQRRFLGTIREKWQKRASFFARFFSDAGTIVRFLRTVFPYPDSKTGRLQSSYIIIIYPVWWLHPCIFSPLHKNAVPYLSVSRIASAAPICYNFKNKFEEVDSHGKIYR